MGKTMKISAVVVTRNEEARIASCLISLNWVDEIIVVDNGSIDNTCGIAKSQGAVVVPVGNIRNFATLHDVGASKSHGDWLLYIDADETVSPELKSEILQCLSRQSVAISGYRLVRKNSYLGRPWPKDEHILRLIRKDSLKGWYGSLHETARVTGVIADLSGAIYHDTHRNLTEMVSKTNEWSVEEAKLRFNAGHPPMRTWRFIRVMVTAFWSYYVVQGGWRVGTVGLIESVYQSFSMFITYAKLWELQDKQKR